MRITLGSEKLRPNRTRLRDNKEKNLKNFIAKQIIRTKLFRHYAFYLVFLVFTK